MSGKHKSESDMVASPNLILVLVHAVNNVHLGCTRTEATFSTLCTLQQTTWSRETHKVLHHCINRTLTHVTLWELHLLPVKLHGILVKVELEGQVRRVACLWGILVPQWLIPFPKVIFALLAVLPFSFVLLPVVVPTNGVAPVISGAVYSGKAVHPIGAFIVAYQTIAALCVLKGPPSVSTQATLGKELGVFARFTVVPVPGPVSSLALFRTIEHYLAAGAAFQFTLSSKLSLSTFLTLPHLTLVVLTLC